MNKEKMKQADRPGISVILFTGENCGICHVLEQKFKETQQQSQLFDFQAISIQKHPDTAASCGIYSIPAVLVYVNGRLTIRRAGVFSFQEILNEIRRYDELLHR